MLPGLVRIDETETVSHGAAAAESDAEIVDGIGSEVGENVIAFLKDAAHPVAEPGFAFA